METNNYVQITVLNRAFVPLTTFSGAYDDLHTQQLGGAGTFTFNLDKTDDAVEYLETGNYLVFTDEKDRPQIYTIINSEETHNSIVVYSYEGGIELINKNVEAYTADSAYSFSYYFDKFFKDTPWEIGVNEISGLSRKLEWTSNDTGLGRFLSLLTEFDNVEFKFDVQFEQMMPTKFIVNIYKQIGSYKPEIQAVYGDKLNDISFKKSRAEFVTAIKGVGGTPQANTTETTNTATEQTPINFSDLEYDDGFFRTTKGDPFLYAYKANAQFNPNTADSYIETSYSYDTLSAQELLNRTLTRIKKYSEIQYEITADVKVIDPDIELGDTVTLIDPSYKPALYLEARVSELKKSYTDVSKGSITYTNYKLMTQADKLKMIQSQIPSLTQISNVVTNVIEGSEAIKNTILALTSADGRSTVYYDAKPSNAKEGDTAFVKNPDSGNMEIWNYVGDKWALTAGDATFDDVKKQIDKAQTDAQAAITTANSAVNTANDNAAKFGTDIATLKADLTKSVTDVGAKADTAIGSANEALTQIGTANSDLTTIKSDMDTVKGTLETVATSEQLDGVNKTATSAKALAETNAESIKNTVTKTELTTAKSEWSSAQSTITAGQISTEITKVNQTISDTTKNLVSQTVLNNAIVNSETGTKQVISESIANISVGGRNLIPNSSTQQVLKRPEDNLSYPSWVGRPIYKGLKNNETYTFSAVAKAETTDKSAEQWGIRILGKSGDPQFVAKTLAANTGKRQSLTFTTPDDGISYDIWIYAGAMGQNYTPANLKVIVTVSDYKLETGTLATDWTPAPEDQASVISVNKIEQTFEGMKQTIANAATKTEVTKLAGQVTSTISAVQGGGINLYTDTKNFNNLASWNSSNAWTKTTDVYNGLAVAQTTQVWGGLGQYIQVKKGDVLTYSAYVRNASGTGTSMIFWSLLNNQDEGSYSTATVNPTNNVVTITDSWQRISVTTVATSDGYLRPRLERTTGNTNTLQIAGIKVEKGNLPTDWTPAPEDIQSQITQTQSMIDARVEKDGVVNAINISKEAILINGNKVHITGQTTIDNGIITNAMIANATITGAQIANATIVDANIANINGNKIVANSITANQIAADAFLVGLNNSMGQIQLQPNGIQIDTPSGRGNLGGSGLSFSSKGESFDSSSIYFELMPSGDGSIGVPTLGISGNVMFNNVIYPENAANTWTSHIHFRNSANNEGFLIVNDQNVGIHIKNDGSVWAQNGSRTQRIDPH